MKKIYAVLIGAIIGVVGLNCTATQQQDVKYALSAIQLACVIENETLDDATVAKICNISNDLMPYLQQVLATSRETTKKMAAKAAMPCDGGK